MGQIFLVTALEIGDVLILDGPHPPGKAVDKVAVMGDQQQTALKAVDGPFHPLPAGNVQVVGGLVQNEEVDLLVHEHTKAQTALFPAGEGGDGLEHVFAPELEGRQTVPGLLGGAVTAVEHGVHQIALRVIEDHLLGEVPHLHRGAEADQPGGGRFFAQQNFQEGGFARAVVPQKGDALSAGDHQVHVPEEGAFPKGLGEGYGGEDLVAVELPFSKGGGHGLALGGLVGGSQLFHALFHGEGPLVKLVVAHKGPEVELVHRRLELFQLGLLLFIALELFVKAALFLHHIEGVVPGVEIGLALLQLHDALDHPV